MNESGRSVLRILALVAVAATCTVLLAMNQELVSSFFSQEGWNRSAPEETVRSFVRYAWDKSEGKKAAALLDPQGFEPELKGSKLVSVAQGASMGRFSTPVAKLAPTAKLKEVRSELLGRDGGSFRVLAHYEDGRWGEYRVKKVNGTRLIVKIPDALYSTMPERGPNVY